MSNEPFRVRDLFDPNDVLAQWVFALSATVTDLATAESVFRKSLDDQTAIQTGYHYRQLIARLYEAERVVVALERHQEIRHFLARQSHAAAVVEFLRDHYLPLESFKVWAAFGYARHRTIHHARRQLRTSRFAGRRWHQQARILVDTEAKRLYYEWPEAVMTHVLAGDLGSKEGLADYVERATLGQEI